MKELAEAFLIFAKYGDGDYTSYISCEHDEMYVHIDFSKVSEQDIKRLSEIGFNESEHGTFITYV